VPRINLTSDIIANVPGEPESKWPETLGFVAAMGFGQVHCLAYSPRVCTRVAALAGQVDPATTRARLMEMKDPAHQLQRQVFASQVGRDYQVLREAQPRGGRPGDLVGYAPNDLPVRIDGHPDAAAIGEILEFKTSHRGRYVKLHIAARSCQSARMRRPQRRVLELPLIPRWSPTAMAF
jgi:threonylcarbamoyladenosine tRNA methylthiotransferase MtaB